MKIDEERRGRQKPDRDQIDSSGANNNRAYRYPEDYDIMSNSSQISITEPIVGEVLNKRALTPIKKSKKKLLRKQKREEEKKKKAESM